MFCFRGPSTRNGGFSPTGSSATFWITRTSLFLTICARDDGVCLFNLRAVSELFSGKVPRPGFAGAGRAFGLGDLQGGAPPVCLYCSFDCPSAGLGADSEKCLGAGFGAIEIFAQKGLTTFISPFIVRAVYY